MKNHKYYAVQRQKGLVFAVAAIEYPHGATTCAARAERDLQTEGVSMFKRRIVAESAETQKNFRIAFGMRTFMATA